VWISASREWEGGGGSAQRSAWLSARVKTGVCWPDPVSRKLDLGRYTAVTKQVEVYLTKPLHNSLPFCAILSRTQVTGPVGGLFQGVVEFFCVFSLPAFFLLLVTGYPKKKNLKCLLVGGLTDLFLYWIGYVKPTLLPVNEGYWRMTVSTELKEWIELIPYVISRLRK
jgi:hypothetical protein